MVRRARISPPPSCLFIHFTSHPFSAVHLCVRFSRFCFRVCVPEKPADKMRFDVAWPEYVSKKRKSGEEGSRCGICRRSHRKSFLLGRGIADSMSPGFCFLIRNRMGCGVRRVVLRIKGDVCSMHPNKQIILLTSSSIT